MHLRNLLQDMTHTEIKKISNALIELDSPVAQTLNIYLAAGDHSDYRADTLMPPSNLYSMEDFDRKLDAITAIGEVMYKYLEQNNSNPENSISQKEANSADTNESITSMQFDELKKLSQAILLKLDTIEQKKGNIQIPNVTSFPNTEKGSYMELANKSFQNYQITECINYLFKAMRDGYAATGFYTSACLKNDSVIIRQLKEESKKDPLAKEIYNKVMHDRCLLKEQ